MLNVLFVLMMLSVFTKVAWLGFKISWGMTKLFLALVFAPLILIGLFCSGAVFLAFPLLLMVGVSAMIASLAV